MSRATFRQRRAFLSLPPEEYAARYSRVFGLLTVGASVALFGFVFLVFRALIGHDTYAPTAVKLAILAIAAVTWHLSRNLFQAHAPRLARGIAFKGFARQWNG